MDYLIAWLVWGVAMLLVLAGGFWMTRWIRPLWLRDLLRFLAAATLLVPTGAGSFEGVYAPAWIVFLFEALLQTEGDPVPAMMMLTVAWALAIAAVIAAALFRHFRNRSSAT
ncbi:MAG: hypothetical protein JJT88_04110 [Gammaproteobacteria bacterium]|nr:hypothetical protein [Gammaproteobacteria bacterium]